MPRHASRIARSVAPLLAALAWAGGATTGPGNNLVVVLHAPGRGGEAGELARAIAIQSSDLPVRIETRIAGGTWATRETEALLLDEARAACGPASCLAAVSWDDLPDGRTLLHVADPGDGRVLIREISAEDGATRFETMALICRATIALLLEGGRIGVSAAGAAPAAGTAVPPPPRPEAPPAARPPGKAKPPVEIGIGYALAFRSAEVPVMHGLDLGAGVRLMPRVVLRAGYTLFTPAEISTPWADIRIRRHPASLGADVFPGGECRRWRPGVGLGLFVDAVAEETHRLDDPAGEPRSFMDPLFGLTASVPLAFRISAHLSLVARVSADIYINNVSYIYGNIEYDSSSEANTDESTTRTLEAPWRVQPRAHLGLSISLP